jgi:hypothetical protein
LPIEPKNRKKHIVSRQEKSNPKNVKYVLAKNGVKIKIVAKSTLLKI